jgi:hypothetical protein
VSWCDEDGNYSHKTKTNAEAGVICDSCMRNIAECEGGRLYQYNGSWCCRECTIVNMIEDLETIEADDTFDE